MKYFTKAMLVWGLVSNLWSQDSVWKPVKNDARAEGLINYGRTLDLFEHSTRPEWGYAKPQTDTFAVLHPVTSKVNSPLYVVLHSAGHDVISCIRCTNKVGNHDIYHAPKDHFALYLDCRANKGDWWWGGMHKRSKELTERNGGTKRSAVERRVIDTVQWVIETYEIDPDRVYLCGNSMGGSGALGIGMRHGDVFAAVKANVPAGIEHVSQRMGFAPFTLPQNVMLPDPPVIVDYSGTNDGWSDGHERFVMAMNERKYPLYFYWGPFGHANNHSKIMAVNDLINSFDWLGVRKNEAYAVFTNASSDDEVPWPNQKAVKTSGQLNGWLRWKMLTDLVDVVEIELFLVSPETLETRFDIPHQVIADVSLRRLQTFEAVENMAFKWSYGEHSGEGVADDQGVMTVPRLTMTAKSVVLRIEKQ